MKKTRRPGCKRCAGCKVRCSTVEEQRKRKETEIEKEKTIRVKRPRTVEGSENGEGEKIGVLKRIAEVLEGMLAGQQELIEAVGELVEEQRKKKEMGLEKEKTINKGTEAEENRKFREQRRRENRSIEEDSRGFGGYAGRPARNNRGAG